MAVITGQLQGMADRCTAHAAYIFPPDLLPLVDHNLPEDDGVLHEGEEHKEHAGQQPYLQRRHCVAHGDPRPKTNLEKTFLL